MPAITHPADAALGDPLFRCAGKRVGELLPAIVPPLGG